MPVEPCYSISYVGSLLIHCYRSVAAAGGDTVLRSQIRSGATTAMFVVYRKGQEYNRLGKLVRIGVLLAVYLRGQSRHSFGSE